MQVTSDTLFHFTPSINALKGILSKKFMVTYCHEVYITDYKTHDSYYPMISFCDIPLALAKDHIQKYGSYAIGLTKEWGIKNKLNPVVYIEKDSLLAKDIQATVDNLSKISTALTNQIVKQAGFNKTSAVGGQDKLKTPSKEEAVVLGNVWTGLVDAVKATLNMFNIVIENKELISSLSNTGTSHGSLFRYIKNYRGNLSRNGKQINNYRFYDEREWRFVPALDNDKIKKSLSESEYKKYRAGGKAKPFIPNFNLPFTSEDIKYLIVKEKEDIPRLIKAISQTDNLTRNRDEADILTTKILTVEQLKNDF